MKIDMFKVAALALKGMEIVQAIGNAKGKEAKINAAIEKSTDMLAGAELVTNKDLLKDERLKPFLEEYFTATKALVNKLHELEEDAKALKP